eukprot:gene294-6708_t
MFKSGEGHDEVEDEVEETMSPVNKELNKKEKRKSGKFKIFGDKEKVLKDALKNSEEVNSRVYTMVKQSILISKHSRELFDEYDNFKILFRTTKKKKGKKDEDKNKEESKEESKELEMRDFNGHIFTDIRKICFISDEDYLKSMGGEFQLAMGAGKGSNFIMKTNDNKYILKSITKEESDECRLFMKEFANYFQSNLNTLILPILGHHKINFTFKEINFIVMENLFVTKPDESYDLKGSSVGRNANEKEKEKKQFKDIDLFDNGKIFQIGKSNSIEIIEQIRKDVEFLSSFSIMDYSLLIGITKVNKQEEEIKNEDEFNEKEVLQKLENSRKFIKIYNEDGTELYHIAIIDYFTKWGLKKIAAQNLKGISNDKSGLSTVDPKAYAKRFMAFIPIMSRSSRFSLFERKKPNETSNRNSFDERSLQPQASSFSMKDLDKKDKPIKFGVLLKDGGFQKKSWDKRYFVLYSDGVLEYYKNVPLPKDPTQLADIKQGEFKGSLNVTECTIRSGKARAKKDSVLELDTLERIFYLGFDTTIEMISWESAMRQIGFKMDSKKKPGEKKKRPTRSATKIIREKKERILFKEEDPELIEMREENSNLKIELKKLKNEMEGFQEELKILQEKLKINEEENELKSNENTNLIKKINEKEEEMKEKKNEILNFENEIKNNEEELKDLKEKKEKKIKELKEKVNQLQNQLMEASTNQDSKEETLKQFEEYQKREIEFEEKLTKEKENNDILEKDLNGTKKEILKLQEDYQKLLQEKKILQEENEQYSILKAFYEKTKKELDENKDKNVTLKRKVTSLEDENAELEQKNENLQNQINRLTGKVNITPKKELITSPNSNPIQKQSSTSSIESTSIIGGNNIFKLIDQIKNNDKKLKEIDLNNKSVSDDDLERISKAMKNNTIVKKLDFSNNFNLTGLTIEHVCEMMLENKTLEELIFDNCPLKLTAVEKLISTLEKNHTLIQMSCGSNETNEHIDQEL